MEADLARNDGVRSSVERFWEPCPQAWPAALVAGIVSLAIYAASASPFVGTHDVAELQALAGTGGVAHAGYPTLVLLMRAVAQLPVATLAWRVNVLSGTVGALAVAVLAYAATRLTRRAAIGVLAALAFACSYTMWTESAQIGVHALTLAIGALAFLALLRFLHAPTVRGALAVGLLAGLGLTGHMTSVALSLPVAWVLWRSLRAGTLRAAHVLALALGLAVGLAPFAYTLEHDRPGLRIDYMNDTYCPENGPTTPWAPDLGHRGARLLWLLSGRQYFSEQKYALHTLPMRTKIIAADEALNEFPLPSLAVAGAGFLLLLATGEVGVVAGLWMLGVVACTLKAGTEMTGAWFFLPGAWLLGLSLAVACAKVAARWAWAGLALAVMVAVLPLVRLSLPDPPGPLRRSSLVRERWSRWPGEWSPLRRERKFETFGRAAMAALPQRAIVLCRWSPTGVLRYFAWGQGLRPDLDVRFAPDTDGERFLRRWREAEATGRPVYVSDLPAEADLAGGRAELVLASPWCGLWRLHPTSVGTPARP
jgi:hypothetical protein